MSSPSSGGSGRPAGTPATRGRAGFETLVFCGLAGIIIFVVTAYYLQAINLSREVALQSELRNIRMAVQLFFALNRRFPDSLQELVEKKAVLPDREFRAEIDGRIFESKTPFVRSYLEPLSVDDQGRILDPFGKPYRYSPDRGLVSPGEDRYRGW